MSDSTSVVSFLSDPSTLLALSAVAVGTAWYLSRSSPSVRPVVPLDNQSLEIPVSAPAERDSTSFKYLFWVGDMFFFFLFFVVFY